MQCLCLTCGDEKVFDARDKEELDTLLAQDEMVRRRGALMGAVQTKMKTIRAWDGQPATARRAFAESEVPLAGFSAVETSDLDEVIQLVAWTPCAGPNGVIEIRPIF